MLPCRACSRFFGAHQHATQMMSMIFYVPCCGHVRSECFQVALTLPYHRTKIYSLKFDLRLWICEWCSTFPLWVAKGQAKLAKLARWVWATRLQRQHLPNQFPAWQLPWSWFHWAWSDTRHVSPSTVETPSSFEATRSSAGGDAKASCSPRAATERSTHRTERRAKGF